MFKCYSILPIVQLYGLGIVPNLVQTISLLDSEGISFLSEFILISLAGLFAIVTAILITIFTIQNLLCRGPALSERFFGVIGRKKVIYILVVNLILGISTEFTNFSIAWRWTFDEVFGNYLFSPITHIIISSEIGKVMIILSHPLCLALMFFLSAWALFNIYQREVNELYQPDNGICYMRLKSGEYVIPQDGIFNEESNQKTGRQEKGISRIYLYSSALRARTTILAVFLLLFTSFGNFAFGLNLISKISGYFFSQVYLSIFMLAEDVLFSAQFFALSIFSIYSIYLFSRFIFERITETSDGSFRKKQEYQRNEVSNEAVSVKVGRKLALVLKKQSAIVLPQRRGYLFASIARLIVKQRYTIDGQPIRLDAHFYQHICNQHPNLTMEVRIERGEVAIYFLTHTFTRSLENTRKTSIELEKRMVNLEGALATYGDLKLSLLTDNELEETFADWAGVKRTSDALPAATKKTSLYNPLYGSDGRLLGDFDRSRWDSSIIIGKTEMNLGEGEFSAMHTDFNSEYEDFNCPESSNIASNLNQHRLAIQKEQGVTVTSRYFSILEGLPVIIDEDNRTYIAIAEFLPEIDRIDELPSSRALAIDSLINSTLRANLNVTYSFRFQGIPIADRQFIKIQDNEAERPKPRRVWSRFPKWSQGNQVKKIGQGGRVYQNLDETQTNGRSFFPIPRLETFGTVRNALLGIQASMRATTPYDLDVAKEKIVGIMGQIFGVVPVFASSPVDVLLSTMRLPLTRFRIFAWPRYWMRFLNIPNVKLNSGIAGGTYAFEPPDRLEALKGNLHIGKIIREGRPYLDYFIRWEDLALNMYVNGLIGQGKSSFVMNVLREIGNHSSIPFLVLDLKGEYSFLQRYIQGLTVLRPGINFGMNIFRPENCHPSIHGERILEIIRNCLFDDDTDFTPQMEETFVNVFTRCCSDPVSGDFKSFFAELNRYRDTHSNIFGIDGTITGITTRIRRIASTGISCLYDGSIANGWLQDELDENDESPTVTSDRDLSSNLGKHLLEGRIVVDFSSILDLGGNIRDIAFCAFCLLKYVWDTALTRPSQHKLKHITVIEDIGYFLPNITNSRLSVLYIEGIPKLLRAKGEALISVNTRPELSDDVLANSGVIVCFNSRLAGHRMKDLLKLSDEQANFLARLPKRHAIVNIASVSEPFLIVTKDFHHPTTSLASPTTPKTYSDPNHPTNPMESPKTGPVQPSKPPLVNIKETAKPFRSKVGCGENDACQRENQTRPPANGNQDKGSAKRHLDRLFMQQAVKAGNIFEDEDGNGEDNTRTIAEVGISDEEIEELMLDDAEVDVNDFKGVYPMGSYHNGDRV